MRTDLVKAVFFGALMMDALLIGLVVYLAFIFPRTVALWADSSAELSTGQQWLVHASGFCTHHGWVLLPILFLAALGTLAQWALITWKWR